MKRKWRKKVKKIILLKCNKNNILIPKLIYKLKYKIAIIIAFLKSDLKHQN